MGKPINPNLRQYVAEHLYARKERLGVRRYRPRQQVKERQELFVCQVKVHGSLYSVSVR